MNEVWKVIADFDGRYMVSNLGRVKSLSPYGRKEKVIILKPRKKNKKENYLSVALYKNGKQHNKFIHRLVWETFIGPIPDGYQINHLDENPLNCCLSNLSAVTPKENCNYGSHNAKCSASRINGKKSKPVNQYTLDGHFVASYPSQREVERLNGYCQGYISACCRGKHKSAYGFLWQYS